MEARIKHRIYEITQGPYDQRFVNFCGMKPKFFIHQEFNPLSKKIYYIRQSKEGDQASSRHWQLTNLGHQANIKKNTVVSFNSAYLEKSKFYILDLIKYISNYNKDFTIVVADFSRFSRSLEVTSDIYTYLFDNKIKMILDVNGQKYNYLNSYWISLRGIFSDCESFSKELSREMKLVYKRRKILALRAEHSALATNYFKWFITHGLSFYEDSNKFLSLARFNFSPQKLSLYRQQTQGMFSRTKELYYFYCPIINCQIICPENLSYIEDLDSSIILGFSKADLLSIAHSPDKDLQWSCYPYDVFEMDEMLDDLQN